MKNKKKLVYYKREREEGKFLFIYISEAFKMKEERRKEIKSKLMSIQVQMESQ